MISDDLRSTVLRAARHAIPPMCFRLSFTCPADDGRRLWWAKSITPKALLHSRVDVFDLMEHRALAELAAAGGRTAITRVEVETVDHRLQTYPLTKE